MCGEETHHFSRSNNLVIMSTSSNSPVEEGDKSEFREEKPKEAAEEKPTEPPEDRGRQKGKEVKFSAVAGDDGKDQAAASAAAVSSSRDPQNELSTSGEDDEECFKTPTSSDHKIPTATQCPPAPIKPRAANLMKRKASPPPGLCRSLQYEDSSTEVESIFRPAASGDKKDDNVEGPENKRPKSTGDGGD